MRKALLVAVVFLAFAMHLCADANLSISDVGLHGYVGTPSAVRLVVRNPSPQPQLIHLHVAATNPYGNTNSVSTDISLIAGEERQIEMPLVMGRGETKVTADASAGGSLLGHDTYDKVFWRPKALVVIMCRNETDVCKTSQSQIQFSGSIENRADKNRQMAFEVIEDARDHWWAYTGATSMVLAMPLTKLLPTQQRALEDYLRFGGRLVLVEPEIADRKFLAAYRNGPAPPNGELVSKGTLFRVTSMNMLGDVFAGQNLVGVINGNPYLGWYRGWPHPPFVTTPSFPRLRSLLSWLAAYESGHARTGAVTHTWYDIPLNIRAPMYLNPFFFLTASFAPPRQLYGAWTSCAVVFIALSAVAVVLTLRNLNRHRDV